MGWSKNYEFTESDLRVACDTLDTWIEATAMGRTNLPPEKVPWKAIRTLLADCIYGGMIFFAAIQVKMALFYTFIFNTNWHPVNT